MEREVIQMQEIFRFIRTGTASDGQIKGNYIATGVRPTFMEDLQIKGFSFPSTFFDPAV
jgi:pilus assembly protein CpaF